MQIGKPYEKDSFDQKRYEQLQSVIEKLIKKIYPAISEYSLAILVTKDEGYTTPNVDS